MPWENDAQKYVDKLRDFYEEQKIGFDSFDCPRRDECKDVCVFEANKKRGASGEPVTSDNIEMLDGADAHVGSKYGEKNGEKIRIVVVSLDTGNDSDNLEARRLNIEGNSTGEKPNPPGKKPNPHMRGTLEILRALYGADEGDDSVLQKYAMTNAAKCSAKAGNSAKDGNMDMAPAQLYDNCRDFARGELSELDPDLVVAEGVQARKLMSPQYKRMKPSELGEIKELLPEIPSDHRLVWGSIENTLARYINIRPTGDRKVVWIIAPHPSARGGQWQSFRDISLPIVSHFAMRLATRYKNERTGAS